MKTIEVDPFDIKSVNAAIAALKKHEVWRKQKITEYIHKLCLEGARAAKAAYGGQVDVHVMEDGRGIIAQGDQVIFLEFGAGVYTEDHGLTIGSDLNIIIAPGGWSEGDPEGQHTWSQWVASGRPLEKYPYNQKPRAGMLEAYKAIVAAQDRIANEVFNK